MLVFTNLQKKFIQIILIICIFINYLETQSKITESKFQSINDDTNKMQLKKKSRSDTSIVTSFELFFTNFLRKFLL